MSTDTSYDNLGGDGSEEAPLVPEVIPGNAILPQPSDFERMLETSRSQALEDPEQVSRTIAERILSAGSVEEVLTPGEARHARELLDTPVTVHAVHFNQSDFEDGIGFYAVVDVTDTESGDTFAVTCGGRNVMAQLYQLARLNALPCDVRFTQARKPTRAGYWPLWLVKA